MVHARMPQFSPQRLQKKAILIVSRQDTAFARIVNLLGRSHVRHLDDAVTLVLNRPPPLPRMLKQLNRMISESSRR